MQIHELDPFIGDISEDTLLAIDDGVETCKIPASELLKTVLVLSIDSFNSLPKTVSNTAITDSMVCIKAELGTPAAQTSDWTVNTSNGSLEISGTISGSTTAKLYLISER